MFDFGGLFGISKRDISNDIKEYDPKVQSDHDRRFVSEITEWMSSVIEKISDDGVYALAVSYQLGGDENDEWSPDFSFAYNTEQYFERKKSDPGLQARWNFINWKEEYIGGLDNAAVKRWLAGNNWTFDEYADEDTIEDLAFDILVLAVIELHKSNVIKNHFGKELPVIIHGMEYYDKTAVMSVKANGAGLLDKEFFDMCGCNAPEIK